MISTKYIKLFSILLLTINNTTCVLPALQLGLLAESHSWLESMASSTQPDRLVANTSLFQPLKSSSTDATLWTTLDSPTSTDAAISYHPIAETGQQPKTTPAGEPQIRNH